MTTDETDTCPQSRRVENESLTTACKSNAASNARVVERSGCELWTRLFELFVAARQASSERDAAEDNLPHQSDQFRPRELLCNKGS